MLSALQVQNPSAKLQVTSVYEFCNGYTPSDPYRPYLFNTTTPSWYVRRGPFYYKEHSIKHTILRAKPVQVPMFGWYYRSCARATSCGLWILVPGVYWESNHRHGTEQRCPELHIVRGIKKARSLIRESTVELSLSTRPLQPMSFLLSAHNGWVLMSNG
jgi:hypothetical protein